MQRVKSVAAVNIVIGVVQGASITRIEPLARAERFQTTLPTALGGVRGVMMARSANLRLWGEAAAEVGDKPQAVAVTARAVAINLALLAQTPHDPVVLRKMALSR